METTYTPKEMAEACKTFLRNVVAKDKTVSQEYVIQLCTAIDVLCEFETILGVYYKTDNVSEFMARVVFPGQCITTYFKDNALAALRLYNHVMSFSTRQITVTRSEVDIRDNTRGRLIPSVTFSENGNIHFTSESDIFRRTVNIGAEAAKEIIVNAQQSNRS